MRELKTTWDFVEEYFPGYHRSELIHYSSCLSAYLNDSNTDSLDVVYSAICSFDENFSLPGDDENELEDFDEYNSIATKALEYIDGLVYGKAIEGYLKQQQC